jgi:hypothetical protein
MFYTYERSLPKLYKIKQDDYSALYSSTAFTHRDIFFAEESLEMEGNLNYIELLWN